MATALRIIPEYYSGGSAYASAIDFDENEYINLGIGLPQNDYIQDSLTQCPNIYDAGKAYAYNGTDKYILTITILYKRSTTEARVLSLFDYEMRYKVYHNYLGAPATFRYYILDPNYDIMYVMGEKLYRSIKLTFYETYHELA